MSDKPTDPPRLPTDPALRYNTDSSGVIANPDGTHDAVLVLVDDPLVALRTRIHDGKTREAMDRNFAAMRRIHDKGWDGARAASPEMRLRSIAEQALTRAEEAMANGKLHDVTRALVVLEQAQRAARPRPLDETLTREQREMQERYETWLKTKRS